MVVSPCTTTTLPWNTARCSLSNTSRRSASILIGSLLLPPRLPSGPGALRSFLPSLAAGAAAAAAAGGFAGGAPGRPGGGSGGRLRGRRRGLLRERRMRRRDAQGERDGGKRSKETRDWARH